MNKLPVSNSKNLLGTALSSGAVAPFLAFAMGRRIALMSLVPFCLSVVAVIAGLYVGVFYGVDFIADLLRGIVVWMFTEGAGQNVLITVVAWPAALLSCVVLGYQFGFLLSLPFLDRLALAVELREGWRPAGQGLGLLASALSVSLTMMAWFSGSALFLVLGMIPGIGFVFVLLGFLWTSLCIALDALDPSLCRAGLTLRERLALVGRHKLPVLGFGALASFWMVIPGSYPGIIVGGARLAARLLKSEAIGQGRE
jgi:uncharacterized protein involved in cysteine biosynthesis